MKKAQGISLNVIIIAAIALLVLVVLSVIFLGRTGMFARKTADCLQQGGTCKVSCDTTAGEIPYTSYTCDTEGEVCCLLGGG